VQTLSRSGSGGDVPELGLAHVVPHAQLAPAVVDVDEMADRPEGRPVIETALSSEVIFGQLVDHLEDAVARSERDTGSGSASAV
jgi:hypothetical protein